MKINEAEALVGITRKNIRFYEQEGLLTPRRNRANGYRDYGEEDVTRLQQIKLLRKLGLPLSEIRRIFGREQTLSDALNRHGAALRRERARLEQSLAMTASLAGEHLTLDTLDAAGRLQEMEQLGTGRHHVYEPSNRGSPLRLLGGHPVRRGHGAADGGDDRAAGLVRGGRPHPAAPAAGL
ncbi:MAG: MerR family transcriptional regulator [Clostridiales bacterium]|nr:MerR family transcriptional regulator [Clostridiales bacterium]